MDLLAIVEHEVDNAGIQKDSTRYVSKVHPEGSFFGSTRIRVG